METLWSTTTGRLGLFGFYVVIVAMLAAASMLRH
jgi:hypothetical protein